MSGPHDSSPDAKHDIASAPNLLWPFRDNSYFTTDGKSVTAAVIDYRFLDGTDDQKQAVRTTIETDLKPAGSDFVTWEDCGNVKFNEVKGNAGGQIRITFRCTGKDDGYWSALGTDALDNSKFPSHKPTMELSGLPKVCSLGELDSHRRNILHEFGHILGLHHEHQSSTLGVLGDLDEDERTGRRNVLDRVQDPTNFVRFDEHSIMVYTTPSRWQKMPRYKSSKKIVFNDKLSQLDQAFIRLIYPPDLSKAENVRSFFQAMSIAGVPKDTAGRMLKAFVENGGSLSQRLTSMRNHFNRFEGGLLLLSKPNQALMRTIDPTASRRSSVNEFIGDVTKDKLFQAIVKNITYRTMEQYGIQTKVSLPGSTQPEVARMLGALAMHDDVGYYVSYYNGQLSGKTPGGFVPPTKPPAFNRNRFNDIIPALLEYMGMVGSGESAEESLEKPITHEELDSVRERLMNALNNHSDDDVPADVQRGLLTELPGFHKILSWFSRTASEGRIDARKIPSSAINKMLDMLQSSSPQNIFQEVYSLCFASTYVHDINGTQKALQMKLQELLKSLLPAVSTHGSGWELVWGPVVWKVAPDDDSGGPDLAWYIAYNGSVKCGEDDEPRPTYVIAVAGTQTRSVHTWINSNFDVTSPFGFKSWLSSLRSNPYEFKLADVDWSGPYLARGTARTVWQLLTVPAPAGAEAAGQPLLDFLKSKSRSNPDLRLITTGHSLGGALSPTLALVLVEVDVVPRDRVLTYSIAGPSPGNDAFATLFSETFPPIPARQGDWENQKYQIWNFNLVNAHDPVPQAWSSDNTKSPKQNLKNIRNMIPGSYIKSVVSAIISDVLRDLTKARVLYMPLRSQMFSARPSESFKDVKSQHTGAYHEYVGITPPDLLDALK